MSRLIIIFALALAGAVTVLVLFANLLLVATNAGAQNRPTEMIPMVPLPTRRGMAKTLFS